MEWQPIETAPKDGTPIMVYGKADFSNAPHMGVREWRQWTVDYGRWGEPNISAHDMDDWLDIQVTHWMPLPSPPATT
jgi:hypothetical protein